MAQTASLDLPADLVDRIKARAATEGASEAAIIREGLEVLDGLDSETEVWLRTVGAARAAELGAAQKAPVGEVEARILTALRSGAKA